VPPGVPPDFECAWRRLAYRFAATLPAAAVSPAVLADVFDALQLAGLCNASLPAPVAPPLAAENAAVAAAAAAADALAPPTRAAGSTLYVDASGGSDANSGSESAPLRHLAYAVAKARGLPPPATVVLRGGPPHRLNETLELTSADSGLSIVAYPGEQPVVSGGYLLNTSSWERAQAAAPGPACPGGGAWLVKPGENAMYAEWPSPSIVNLTAAADAQACEAACAAFGNCTAFIFYDASFQPARGWAGRCFVRTDGRFPLTAEAGITSGHCMPAPAPRNVWSVDLAAAGTPLPAFITAPDWVLSLLFSDNGGRALQRAIRARFPNGDPETVQWPEGWAAGGTWTAPTPDENTTVIQVPFPRNYPGMFQDYFLGVGGPCKVYNESDNNEGFGPVQSVGYWCQPHGRTGGALYFSRQPSALTLGAADLPNAPYALPAATSNGATLSFWRPSHWYNSLAKLASATTAPGSGETTLAWTFGAFHGGEGADAGEDWVVEHVLEELDAPREFFFDAGAQRLHFFHNASAGVPPPPDWSFEVPLLRCLLRVTGTPEAPVAGVTLSGITFTSAAAAVLANRGIPTGGDWSVARVGALTVEGAAGLTLRGLNFTRLDGNAVSINGWNRDINIVGCEFAWLGESAVASWGRADGADARRGTQPLRTNMSGCVCREIGLIEKQNSCYFGALSGSATIADNIFYNMPRAAVCFEDDALGGSIVTRNLVFNTCRESQDHGPFNSWGRVPFSVNFPNGSDSGGLKPQPDEISLNFLVAGGGANSGAADHDDGSSGYNDFSNFMVYGGHKSNFFGHSKRSSSNIMAFPLVYQPLCLRIYAGLPPASPGGLFAEGFTNNTCILASASDLYMNLGSPCVAGEPDLALRIRLGGNTVYAPAGGLAGVLCGNATLPFEAWSATGSDPGTVHIEGVPSSELIVEWAAALLGIPPAA
jgi:hypothetical protein